MSLINFDFVDSGVTDLEFRKLSAALESVMKQADLARGRTRRVPDSRALHTRGPFAASDETT